MTTIVRSGTPARAGALLILLGPLVSWVAEFITAAAWQDPPYSPLYNWVSHLGLTGPPQTAFGQVANSPLGAARGIFPGRVTWVPSWTSAGWSTASS